MALGDFATPNDGDSDGWIHGLAPLYEPALRNSAEIGGQPAALCPVQATTGALLRSIDGAPLLGEGLVQWDDFPRCRRRSFCR